MSDHDGSDRPDENAPAGDPTPAVVVVTDSSCDLPASVADELGIVIVPLTIRFGDEEFVDRVELTTAEFWSRCVNSPTLPETAAPAPGQFEQAYRDAAARGASSVLVVSLSSALSATMQSAILAGRTIADDDSVDLDVRVVDSRTITMGLGTIALACARAARDGAGIDDVEALAHDLVERTRVFGALDTLDNLKKGGRIGNARALLATALSIKPIIEVTGGVVEQARQAAHAVEGTGVPRRQGRELRRQDREPGGPARRLQRRRPVRRAALAALPRRDRRRGDRSGDRHPRRTRHDRCRVPGRDDLSRSIDARD